MKTAIFVLGILTGLAFSRIPHYVNLYADHSLPKAYEGPKYELGGRRVTREEFEQATGMSR